MNKNSIVDKLITMGIILIATAVGVVLGIMTNTLIFSWFSSPDSLMGHMISQWGRLIGVTIGVISFTIGATLPSSRSKLEVFNENSRLKLLVGVLVGGFGYGMIMFYVFLNN